jgi:hypothetical protein
MHQIDAAPGEERTAQIDELRKFLGDGSSMWVTRESADSDKPILMPADTAYAENRCNGSRSFIG